MGVRVNDRGESGLEFLTNAHELEKLITKAVGNEKIIPKKHRFTIGQGLLKHAVRINDCVILGNETFLKNPSEAKTDKEREKIIKNLKKRYKYQLKVLKNLRLLEERLTVASEMLNIPDSFLEEAEGLLYAEEGAVKKWMDSDRRRIR